MIYTWDKENRDKTFKLCIDTLNRVKGLDIKFNFCEAGTTILSVWLICNGRNYERTYYWIDLARATQKTLNNNVDFEKLTGIQYLNLCKYITKDLWEIVRIL